MYLKKLFSCIMNVSNKPFYIKQHLSYHLLQLRPLTFLQDRNILITYTLHFIILPQFTYHI